MRRLLFLIGMVGLMQAAVAQARLEGYLRERISGKPLTGVSVFIKSLNRGVSSDSTGFYQIGLPPGDYFVRFSKIGYQTTTPLV